MLLFCNIISEKYENNQNLDIDEQLFVKIGNGDMNALEELYILTERTLYAYVFSIIKNHNDAIDIVQDTYIKIKSAAHLYKPMNKPLAWMFTISKNLTISRLRKTNRVTYIQREDMENSELFAYEMDRDDRIVLMAVLDKLDEKERSIIMLHAVSGMKHREIADCLNMPLSTVLSKYNRGLKKLKKYLSEGVGI